MKKLLSVLSSTLQGGARGVLLFMALLATTTLWAYDFQSGDLYYNITNDVEPYTVEVTSHSSSYPYNEGVAITTATIPSTVTYNGTTYSVTSIGEDAFAYCSSLTSITIPNSVTSIGDYAFESCSSLASIAIPNSVTSIGYGAFFRCSSIATITIPNSVTSIGKSAFEDCSSLTSITIPNSVTSIGNYAFESCSSLTSIIIPNSVTYIGDYAFRDCSSLTSVIIPNSVKYIEDYAFRDCSSLTSVTIGNSVTSIGEEAFSYCSSLSSIVVKTGNTTYDSRDKSNAIIETATNTLVIGCKNTIIPNSVTSIGEKAFLGCSSLTSITIPYGVTSIGDGAFYWCSSIDTVVWNAKNCADFASIIKAPFEDSDSIISFTFGDSVEHIPSYLCTGMYNIISMTIPNSVKSIGDGAFFRCSSIDTVVWNAKNCADFASIIKAPFEDSDSIISFTFGDSVEHIPSYLCTGMYNIISMTIPNSVKSIGGSAFAYCSSLTSVTIPNSVKSIGAEAFYDCSSLTKTNYTGDVAGWCNIKFGGSTSNPMCYSQNFYINDQEIKDLVIPNTVDSIHDYVFAGCSSLTSVTIPNSVTSIGDYAFLSCSGLTSVTIPNSVTSIGEGAFRNCSSLTSITIPNSVTSIGYGAFSNCSFLTSVTIGNGITNIGNEAFLNCKSLNSIKIEAITPPTLGRYVHDGGRLPIIYIPDNTLSAYQQAWGNEYTYINNETTLTIHVETPGTLKDLIVDAGTRPMLVPKLILTGSLNADDFTCMRGTMTSLVDVDLSGITNTSGVDFNNKENLVRVILPINLTSIEDGAFAYCSSLTSITIPNSVTSIGDRAFAGCTSLTFIVVNNGNTTYNSRENCNAIIETSTNTLIAGCRNTIIPNSVTSIGDYAFYYYSSLSSITIPNSVTSIGDSAFYRCFGLTAVTIGNSVTSIGNSAFYYCESLTYVTIPNSVTSIGDDAFCGCSNLDSIIIGNGVTSIGDYAFNYCKSLYFVTIPNSVKSIGDYAFWNCEYLHSVTIGNGVKNIGYNAFHGCTLDTVTCLAMTPPALDWSFYDYDNSILLVPCEALSDYWKHEEWGLFINIECIASEEVETEEVIIESNTTTVTVTWPAAEGADIYTIVIKKGDEVFSTLTFNADGQLLNIAFAPGRDGNHPAQYAEQTTTGYRFTVTGLEEGTDYTYTITVKDVANTTIKTHSGKFTTLSHTAVDNITTNHSNIQKIIRNGQIIIVRDGVEYNIMGKEL